MKIQIAQSTLLNTLSTACLAVPSKPAHPILNSLLLAADVEQQKLLITTFDLSLGIQVFVDCSVESGGTVALPAKLLNDVVSHLDKCEITLEVNNYTATITHISGRCRIQGTDPEEFPILPEAPDNKLAIPSVELLNALKATIFAASKDSTKLVLAGIHFKFTPSTWETAATDGHRLAVVSGTIKSEDTAALELVEATVPYQTFAQLERILTGISCCNCTISISNSIVAFEISNIRITSRLLEGQYPKYLSIIPTQFQYEFTLDKKACSNALKRVNLVAEQKDRIARIAFDLVNQNVTVSAESSELGGAVEALPFEANVNECENLEIGFNIRYLLDALKITASERVLLKVNAPDQPVLIKPVGNMVNQLIMIMPVQIQLGETSQPNAVPIPTEQEIPDNNQSQTIPQKK